MFIVNETGIQVKHIAFEEAAPAVTKTLKETHLLD
jgi:hypothetical protein